MQNKKKILALITARGGSKSIPKKNIKVLGNKPLITWTIEAAHRSKYIDRLILSSDDSEIISIAKQNKCEVPFIRPAHLALDTSTSMDVIFHALDSVDSSSYEYILLLQPTSPFRTAKHIDELITSCIEQDAEIMVSVSRLRKHPAHTYEMKDGFLRPFGKHILATRRQDMPLSYEHNGAIYMAKIDFLRASKTFNTDLTKGYVMDEICSLDIDEELDWMMAECIINRRVIG